METGRYEEADRLLRKGLEIRPDLPWASFYVVLNLWLWKGDLAETRALLESAPASDVEAGTYLRYEQHLYEGDPAGALDLLDRSSIAWFRLGAVERPLPLLAGLAYRALGDTSKARQAFDEARRVLEAEIAAREDSRTLRSSLGIAYAALGRGEEGIREGRLALELYPFSKDAVWSDMLVRDLAWIHTLAGDHDGALDRIEELRGIVQAEVSATTLEIDPMWAPLRSHPRYPAVLESFKQRAAGSSGTLSR